MNSNLTSTFEGITAFKAFLRLMLIHVNYVRAQMRAPTHHSALSMLYAKSARSSREHQNAMVSVPEWLHEFDEHSAPRWRHLLHSDFQHRSLSTSVSESLALWASQHTFNSCSFFTLFGRAAIGIRFFLTLARE